MEHPKLHQPKRTKERQTYQHMNEQQNMTNAHPTKTRQQQPHPLRARDLFSLHFSLLLRRYTRAWAFALACCCGRADKLFFPPFYCVRYKGPGWYEMKKSSDGKVSLSLWATRSWRGWSLSIGWDHRFARR